jgi:hypothetical protein
MRARFAEPLRDAWERMRTALFRPFDVAKWLVWGFAAWLSRLGQSGGGWPGGNWWPDDPAQAQEFLRKAAAFAGEVLRKPLWLGIGLAAILLVLAVAVVLMWVSSRGKFVFLDSVVQGRPLIVEPWVAYARQGNSLFLWRLGFSFIGLAVTLALVCWGWLSAVSPWLAGKGFRLLPAVSIAAVWVPLMIVMAYVGHFLENFVVPIMYRERLGANGAWGRFLPLFGSHAGAFLLYGLAILGIFLALGAALLVVGCVTCCIGFLVLWLPYVWAVLLLPLLYAYRALGPLFLAQFGPEWSVFPPPPPVPAAGAGGQASAQ